MPAKSITFRRLVRFTTSPCKRKERLSRFQRKHPKLAGRIPKKELAAYLNLTPETLSRLKQKLGND